MPTKNFIIRDITTDKFVNFNTNGYYTTDLVNSIHLSTFETRLEAENVINIFPTIGKGYIDSLEILPIDIYAENEQTTF